MAQHLGRLAGSWGDVEAAEEHLEAAVSIERRAGAPLFAAHSLRARAELLGKCGGPRDRERARQLHIDARAAYAEMDHSRAYATPDA